MVVAVFPMAPGRGWTWSWRGDCRRRRIGATVETARRVAVWVAAVYWVCCLATHVVVAATRPGPLPGYTFAYWFILTMGVSLAAAHLTRRAGADANDPPWPWYVVAIAVTALASGMWPMAVGSGVPNAPSVLGVFEDTGVAGGPPGDRSLDSHGRRVRAITEEEYQRVRAWEAVIQTGIMAAFSGMALAGTLCFQQARRASNEPRPTPAATQDSGK